MWSFLEDCDVWCINLITRGDKYEHSREQFEKIGLLDRIQYYRPEKYTGPIAQKGCWDSHKYCLEESAKNGRNALIFEDDVVFDDNWVDQYTLIEAAYTTTDWEILRLGSYVFAYDKEVIKGIWSGELNTTHAYFIRNEFIKLCIKDPVFSAEKYPMRGIDEYYRFECKKNYILVQQIAWQHSFQTDNIWFQSCNVWQLIFEYKPIFVLNQKCMNAISWQLRYFPQWCKILNPYVIMFNANDYFLT